MRETVRVTPFEIEVASTTEGSTGSELELAGGSDTVVGEPTGESTVVDVELSVELGGSDVEGSSLIDVLELDEEEFVWDATLATDCTERTERTDTEEMDAASA